MLFVEEDHTTPLVRFKIQSPMGAAFDPVGLEGLTHHALALARTGAADKSREELDVAIDALGASLDFRCAYHWIALEGVVLSEHLDKLFSLALDILTKPMSMESDFARLLRESQNALIEMQDDGEQLLAINYRQHASVFSPYHRPVLGTKHSLGQISLEKAKQWYQYLFPKNETVVGFSGDITDVQANKVFERLCLKDPPTPSIFMSPSYETTTESDNTFYYLDKPTNDQCNIELAFDAPRCQGDFYPHLLIANNVLGELESSRLNQSIRAKEGWVYSVYSSTERHPDKNILSISCNPAVEFTHNTIKAALAALSDLSEQGITEDEYDLATSNIIGSLDFVGETCHRRLAIRIRNHFFGLPTSYYAELKSKLETTTRNDVNSFLADFFKKQNTTIGLVGPWDAVPELKNSLPFQFENMAPKQPD